MLQAAQEAGMRCDVVVLDGNAKNRRAVCAAALAGSSHSEHLRRTLRPHPHQDVGLPPCFLPLALRRTYGRRRSPSGARGWVIVICVAFFWLKKMCPCLRPQLQDVEIVHHKVVNDGQQLRFLLKETMEPQREAWVSDACVPAAVLSKYVRQVGQEKLKPRKRSHEDQSQKPWRSIFSISISFSACGDKQSCRPAAALRLHRSHVGHLFYAQRKHSCPKAA